MRGKMRAGILSKPQSLAVKKIDIPAVGDNDVLLKVANCGICGTDLHLYMANVVSPHPNGHEISGEVIEVGKNVYGFRKGDRVAVEINIYCGKCRFCLSGNYNLCMQYDWIGGLSFPGGNAEYLSIPSYTLHHLPDSLSFEEGALLEPLAVGVHAVRLAQVSPGSRMAILGSGTVGLTTLLAAKAYGALHSIVSAKYEHQALMSEKLGADTIVRCASENLEETVKKLTDNEGVDITFVAAATTEAFEQACKITRKKGKIILLALIFEGAVNLRIPWETTVSSSFVYGSMELKKDYEIAIDLVSSKTFDVKSLITHKFPLGEIDTAFKTALDKNTQSIKVLICP